MFLEIVKYTIIKPFVKPAVKGVYRAKKLFETKKEEKKEEDKTSIKDLLYAIVLLLICALGILFSNKEYSTKIIAFFENLFY